MAQETAVDWFVNEVFGKNGLIIYADKIEKAKAMEKEQIEEARQQGYENGYYEAQMGDDI